MKIILSWLENFDSKEVKGIYDGELWENDLNICCMSLLDIERKKKYNAKQFFMEMSDISGFALPFVL